MSRTPYLIALTLLICGCDPFAAMTTEIDEKVPSDKVGQIDLLGSPEKLPANAAQVQMYFLQFQDPVLRIRFRLPIREAEAFVVRYIGQPLQNGCHGLDEPSGKPTWWLRACPPNARFAEQIFSDNPPARTAVIVPDGDFATVWIYTFGT